MLLQGIGWRLVWMQAQYTARSESRQPEQTAQKEIFKITLHGDDWEKNRVEHKEIRWKGHLYDVKSRQIQGDSVVLLLHHDAKEERLLALLEHILRPPAPFSSMSGHSLELWRTWMATVYLRPEIPGWHLYNGSSQVKSTFFYVGLRSLPFSEDIFSPPWERMPLRATT